MWTINGTEVLRFQGHGDAFTEFVDSLIRAEAYFSGLSDSEILTNCRVYLPDGGVDTQVRAAIAESPNGWFPKATCWQYKASPFASIGEADLRDEITKPFASELIRRGHAYRFCIADSLTPEKRNAWEGILDREATALNPNAPACRVLTAADLAAWASRLPGIIIKFFRPELAELLHLDSWGQNERALTRHFIEVGEWSAVRASIWEHADFAKMRSDAVLWLQGESGVGKTRLVYEALASRVSLRGLVIYTRNDEQAVRVAAELANDPVTRAILVADECPHESREKVEAMLAGHKDRVRVIAIDNASDSVLGLSPQLRLAKMPTEKVDEVLSSNFPGITGDRRREYARVSGGFVRLAADLCKNNHLIEQAQSLGPAMPAIANYLWRRIANDEERKALLAISLVTRIGYSGDVAQELTKLASLLNLTPDRLLESARRLKDSTGYITEAGRYLYVTPEIIADVAFQAAWRQWISANPTAFLERIPTDLLDRFQKRISHSAHEDAREVVALFFRNWVDTMKPSDLADLEKTERLAQLIETAPTRYLPILAKLVMQATEDELLAISGDHSSGRWGPRRVLVWLSEKLAAFPEYFSEAEEILFTLARAESEPSIANNASGVWRQLFQIVLSGTATPFNQRMDLLEKRLFDPNQRNRELALEALKESLRSFSGATRDIGPKRVGGRLVPDEWRPKANEGRACFEVILDLIMKISQSGSEDLQNAGLEICIKYGSRLISTGDLDFLKTILTKDRLSGRFLPLLLETLDDSLMFDLTNAIRPPPLPVEPDYVQRVRTWRTELVPSDFHGRLLSTIGIDPWHHSLGAHEERWKHSVRGLAAELHADPTVLVGELDWLLSPEARSAMLLGVELGKIDSATAHLSAIVSAVAQPRQNLALARGYLAGLLIAHPEHSGAVNLALDRLSENPEVAYELALVCGRPVKSLQRTLASIRAGKLNASYLQGFIMGYDPQDPLTTQELEEVLAVLLQAMNSGDESSTRVAVQLIGYRVGHAKQDALNGLSGDALDSIFQVLLLAAKDGGGDSYWWGRSLIALASADVSRVSRAASLGLVGGYFQEEESQKILIELAHAHPEEVMRQVGAVMLDDKYGIQFFVGHFTGLFNTLPVTVVRAWLESVSEKGAQKLARHLPVPYVDPSGEATVPKLTEYVLEKFENDDRTFSEFCAGTYSMSGFVDNLATQAEADAEGARRFLSHRLRRVREWAALTIEGSKRHAAHWRELHEERDLD